VVQPPLCTSKWKSSQDTLPIANDASIKKAEKTQTAADGMLLTLEAN
jgi:hypothetical protein